MRPSLALSIAAVYGLVLGVPLVLAPAQMLSAFGFGAPNEALIQSRDLGVTLIGLGIINWMARDAAGAPLRGLLSGNIFMQLMSIAVHTWELVAGVVPSWTAPFLVVPLALVIVYATAFRRA